MYAYLCLAIRYCNNAASYEESLNLAKSGASRIEDLPCGKTKYILSDGSAMIDDGKTITSDENEWWNK